MIKLEALVGLVTVALWIFSLVDVVGTDESRMRHLPKLWWLLIVLFFPLAGSVAWLVAGRPEQGSAARNPRAVPEFPEYDRPGRAAAADPAAEEAFLRRIRERAELQRQQYREQRKSDPEA
ncbi:MAG: PLD nuclease N-terminal domain-containing protein [Marmoricola sp.]